MNLHRLTHQIHESSYEIEITISRKPQSLFFKKKKLMSNYKMEKNKFKKIDASSWSEIPDIKKSLSTIINKSNIKKKKTNHTKTIIERKKKDAILSRLT